MRGIIWHLMTFNSKHSLNPSATCPALDVVKLRDKQGSTHPLATN